MNKSSFPEVGKLNEVLSHLKSKFVGKDNIIDLLGLCLVGRENVFLLGPPGTAKSAMVNELGKLLKGKTFEYLLTRFTEPNEIFGPFDIRKLREGDLITNTEGMLPEASLIFLDELLNANSAILNSLLMVLNERVFRRGREKRDLPALMIVGASNHLPEDEALQALFDRFLIRVRCDNVDPDSLDAVLNAGWALEQNSTGKVPEISTDEVRSLQTRITSVDLTEIREMYMDLIRKLRNAGVRVSDRRAVKLQRLIAASALLCERTRAIPSDLWVLRYIWDSDDQAEVIAGIVNTAVQSDESEEKKHPQAEKTAGPDADELFRQVKELESQWQSETENPAARARIKDRLRYLDGRTDWIANEEQRSYVKTEIDALWGKVLQA